MPKFSFDPDGIYGGVPYRVIESGQIDALLDGHIIRLSGVEQLVAIVSNGSDLPLAADDPHVSQQCRSGPVKSGPSLASRVEAPVADTTSLLRRRHKGPKIVLWVAAVLLFLYIAVNVLAGSGPVARNLANVLNSEFGAICNATLEGWGSNTLRVDWTSRTTKLNAIQVFGAIGTAKSALYGDGIRYFKFPNDDGGYNIVDWKTGEKTSVSQRAPYYFR